MHKLFKLIMILKVSLYHDYTQSIVCRNNGIPSELEVMYSFKIILGVC